MKILNKPLTLTVLILTLNFLTVQKSSATLTNGWWGGNADNDWGNPNNWVAGQIAQGEGSATFGGAPQGTVNTLALLNGFSPLQIGTVSVQGSSNTENFTIGVSSGNSLEILGNISNNTNLPFTLITTGGTISFPGTPHIQGSSSTIKGLVNFTAQSGGMMTFDDSFTAESAIFTNNVGGTMTFNNSATTGNSTITNNGTIVFNSTASSSSATLTNNGILTISQATNLGAVSGGGTINLTSTLTTGALNQNETISGQITGAGGFTKTGTGVLTLSGNNNYTGPTTINTGILAGNLPTNTILTVMGAGAYQLAGNQSIGALRGSGKVNLESFTLTFGGDATYSGVISGAGGLRIVGDVTLGRANTYTGTTTINTGTLTFSGDTSNLGGDILNNSILIFAQQSSSSFSHVISGPGTLGKAGSGTLTLSRANTYTGRTNIFNGTLVNNGSLTSDVFVVGYGGGYAGTGSCFALTNTSGTVSPQGTMVVLRNYTQKGGSAPGILNIGLNSAGNTGLLQVRETAALGGTLTLVPLESAFMTPTQSYTILTATGGVTGTFAATTSSSGLLKYTVQYNPATVVVSPQQAKAADFAGPGNPSVIANHLDQIIAAQSVSPDLITVLLALEAAAGIRLNRAAFSDALEQLSPDPLRELGFLAADQMNLLRGTVGMQQQRILNNIFIESLNVDASPVRMASFQQLLEERQSSFSQKKALPQAFDLSGTHSLVAGNMPLNKRVKIGNSSVWIQSYGQVQDKKNSSSFAGTRNRTFGTSLGGDTMVLPNTYVGAFGGVMGTQFTWKQNRGHGEVNSYYGGLYGLWLHESGLYLDGQVTVGGEHYQTRRKINFQSINRVAKEHHKGVATALDGEIGYLWAMNQTILQPFFNYGYVANHENSFTEKGAGSVGVHGKSKLSHFSRLELGSYFSYFFVEDETLMYPTLKLSWVQKRPLGGENVKFNFVGQTLAATVKGDNKVRNQFSPGLSFTAQFKEGIYLVGDVNGELGSDESTGQAMLTLGYQW